MQLMAHAGAGWLLAEAGMADARFRRAVFLAAILPDIDALPAIVGRIEQHHIWTHNLLFSLLVSVAAAAYCRTHRLRAFGFAQLAFYSHYFGDYFFTQWPLALFWPFSSHGFVSRHACSYYAPINDTLASAGLILMAVTSVLFQRTPIEVLSPQLDRRVTLAIQRVLGKVLRKR